MSKHVLTGPLPAERRRWRYQCPIAIGAFLLLSLTGCRTEPTARPPAPKPAIEDTVDVPPSVAPGPAPKPSSLFFGAIFTTNSPGWETVLPRSEASGALVLIVGPESPVEEAGIRPGDVVVAIDGKETPNEERFRVAQLSSAADRRLFTLLPPDGPPRTVEVRPSKRPVNADYLERKLADNPDVITRILAAQVAADPASGLDQARKLVSDLPSFGYAHALVGLHALRLARSVSGPGPESVPPETVTAVQEELARAIELDPESVSIRGLTATIALELGDAEGSEREALRAVQIDNASAEAHHLLGLSRLVRGDAQAALPDIHRAAVLNPYEPKYSESLVRTYLDLGQEDQATKTRQSVEATFSDEGSAASEGTYGNHPERVAVALGAVVMIAVAVEIARRRRASRDRATLDPSEERASGTLARELMIVELMVPVGVWSMGVPLLAPLLGVTARGPFATELFGRVLPGFAVAVLGVVGARRVWHAREDRRTMGIGIPAALFLCGLWMTGTQVTLVFEAIRSAYPDVAIFRLFPGLMVLFLAGWVSLIAVEAQEKDAEGSSSAQPQSSPAPL